MSDVSVLSKQFEELVDLSNKFNEAIIVLKKKSLLKNKRNVSKAPEISLKEESIKAEDYLITFLKNLLQIVENKNNYAESELSSSIFEDFRKRINSYPFIQEKLNDLISKFKSGKKLENEDFEFLDNLLSELDSEKNVLYKKLRFGRG